MRSYSAPEKSTNDKDPYAVAVLRGDMIVGHVPRRISAACSIFLRIGGTIQCVVTAARRFSADLPQGGLEVPCTLRFIGEAKDVRKLKKVFMLARGQQATDCHIASKEEKGGCH